MENTDLKSIFFLLATSSLIFFFIIGTILELKHLRYSCFMYMT